VELLLSFYGEDLQALARSDVEADFKPIVEKWGERSRRVLICVSPRDMSIFCLLVSYKALASISASSVFARLASLRRLGGADCLRPQPLSRAISSRCLRRAASDAYSVL